MTRIITSRQATDGAIRKIHKIVFQFLTMQKQPILTTPPSEKNIWMNILYFWRYSFYMVSVMKQKQIFIAESDPQPIRNSPIPAAYRLLENTAIIMPSVATPQDISNAFFLPMLSTMMEIEIYPKKHPIQTKEANKSVIQALSQCKSAKALATVLNEVLSMNFQRSCQGREHIYC